MRRDLFHDRHTAGALLGAEVAKVAFEHPVVLGLPRGGVPVAAQVASTINAPLDVIVVRKLGAPHQPELAMGAIGEGSVVIVNHEIVDAIRVDDSQFAGVEVRERAELDRRLRSLRAIRPREPLAGRSTIIVDDGIATGATVRAAIGVARANGAREVTVATPVAPPEVVESLRSDADRVICLMQPDPFNSVGRWYRNFDAVSDREVIDMMAVATTTGRP